MGQQNNTPHSRRTILDSKAIDIASLLAQQRKKSSEGQQYRSQEAMSRWLGESKREAVWNHLAALDALDRKPARFKL